ncbi:hypothetical protein EDB19DRAFT_1785621 [Suillus lakei]|nr:hypothetical protein EDB19DRAFT_1785621 [Suillus lakei]
MRARGKNSTSSVKTRPVEVVGVSAARGFKRIIAWKPKLKTKSPAVTSGTHATAVQASASSQAGPSSQVGPAQTGTSSQAVSGQPGLSLHTMAGHTGRYSQATGGPSSHASPSHITTTYHTHYTSDSRSTIEGSCMRFLDKICFPCGHYYNDS